MDVVSEKFVIIMFVLLLCKCKLIISFTSKLRMCTFIEHGLLNP